MPARAAMSRRATNRSMLIRAIRSVVRGEIAMSDDIAHVLRKKPRCPRDQRLLILGKGSRNSPCADGLAKSR